MPFPDLARRAAEVRERIDASVRRGGHEQSVQIVAVTKTFGPDAVDAAFDAGLHVVGENKVQEALAKMERVTRPVVWHLIGHLQRNKAKSVTRFALVHAVDSARLADAVHDVGRAHGVPVPVLLQVNVAGEEAKGGYAPEEVEAEADRLRSLAGLQIRGAMVMAPLDADERVLRSVFSGGRRARDVLAAAGHPATELSMGMSNDYEIAVEEGATLVRLGTILFGARGDAA